MAGDRTLVYEHDAEILRFVTPDEAARRVGRSTATVKRWAKDGTGGFPKRTASGNFRGWEIDRFVADCRVGATPRIGARA